MRMPRTRDAIAAHVASQPPQTPALPPVGLVQDDNFVAARWQRDPLLRKHLDFVAHDIDATVVRRVQLQHRLPEVWAQQLVRQAQDAGGLAGAGGAL